MLATRKPSVPESVATAVIELSPHPASGGGPAQRITASVRWQAGHPALVLQYRLEGDIQRLVLPRPATPRRVDRLWEHTCFEAFARHPGERDYLELNFSPSGEWAAYRFDGRRDGGRDLPLPGPPATACTRTGNRIDLRVTLDPCPMHGDALDLGLSAILEDREGALFCWALRHPAGPPDFHDPESFTLRLQAAGQPQGEGSAR